MYDRNKEKRERRRNGFVVSSVQMVVSICGFAVGLRAYLFTENLNSGAFWPHATLLLASLLLLIGVGLRHDGRTWMVVGVVFNVFGIFMAFSGAIVDGVQASQVGSTDFSRCTYSTAAGTKTCGAYSLFQALLRGTPYCSLEYPKRSCYCCDILMKTRCPNGVSPIPSYYAGVASCEQVQREYQDLMWASLALCCVNFVVAIVACGLVLSYRSSVQNRCIEPYPQYPMTTQGVPFIIYSAGMTGAVYPQPAQPLVPPAYEDAIMEPGPSAHPPPRTRPTQTNHGEDHDGGDGTPIDPTKWHHVPDTSDRPPPYSLN